MSTTTTQQAEQDDADLDALLRQYGAPQHPLEVLEDVVAGVFAAIGVLVWTGLGVAEQAWIQDRPRRQWKRTLRRRRWRGKPGWRRNLLVAELVFVVGWLITRSIVRFPRAAWRIGNTAAARGWASGVRQARTERATRRGHPITTQPTQQPTQPTQQPTAQAEPAAPGQPSSASAGSGAGWDQAGVVIDVEVLCTWLNEDGSFCSKVLPDGEVFCPHHGMTAPAPITATTAPSRRWDGEPETDADRRFFDLRESGYTGWADRTGEPVETGQSGWPVDGYEPVDADPANAAVPCPACQGNGCDHCGTGQVPAWSLDPAHGVVPPHGSPQMSGAVPAPEQQTASAVATGRNTPAMSTTTTVSTTTRNAGQIATDLQTVHDLRLETDRCSIVLEQFEELGRIIRQWTNTLPERYQAAPFGTKALTAAVNGVSEHGAKSGALREQIEVLRRAIAQAISLGDHVSSLSAEGQTTSYTDQ